MAQARTRRFSGGTGGPGGRGARPGPPGAPADPGNPGGAHGCVCGDLVEALPLAQSTVSQHLKELKEAGLVRGEIDGPRTCYCVDPETLEAVRQGFARLFAGLGCCGSPKED